MKYLIALVVLFSLSGCATAGAIVGGMGRGLTAASETGSNDTMRCTSQYTGGGTTYMNCH